MIDEGYPQGRIPAYNGGLFSPSHYPHIAHTPQPGVKRWEIGDHRLAEVVDTLAYQRERWNEPGTQDIDYNTLDVQHLGSIYEGLLELQPRVADEPMIEVIEDGRSVFKRSREVSNPRTVRGQPPRAVEAGEVYLVTNRGERKATGSYYTPKYIVDYIVQKALGPLVDEAAQKVADLRPEVDKEIRRLERKRREWERAREDRMMERQAAKDQEGRLAAQIEAQKRRLLEPYLSLKILDPAMGSGHFLVGAADFLSLAMATDPNLPPLDEMGDEDPQAFYKRLVVERCLYGVDLNPLAVELAKLSLWLHTVSRDKALSFLDHHLRCGNSLIGARLEEDLKKEPPRFNARGKRVNADSSQIVLGFTETLTAKHLQHFLGAFREIVEMRGGDAESERRKDDLYRTMDATRDKFRAVASAWLAPYFDAPVMPEEYQQAVNALRGTTADWKALAKHAWFQNAQAVARDRRFFHWELEFPEIFFDAHGFRPEEERGFDAVIGNPPWGALLETDALRFLDLRFSARGWNDSYAFFMQLSDGLCRSHGLNGLIVPSSWLTVGVYKAVRQFMLNEGRFKALCYLYRVFDDVNLDESLYIHKRSAKDTETTVCIAPPDLSPSKRLATLSQFSWSRTFDVPHKIWQCDSEVRLDLLVDPLSRSIVEKVKTISVPLDELFEVGIGIQAYCQPKHTPEQIRKRIFHSKTKKDDTYLLCLSGNDVGRYEIDLDNKEYLSVGTWLYAIPNMKVFDTPRILAQQVIWKNLKTCLLRLPDVVHYNSIFHIWSPKNNYSLEFLLAPLNSRFLAWLFPLLSNKTFGDKFPKLSHGDLCRLPIRRIAFTTPEHERARLLEKGKKLCERCLSKDYPKCVLEFVDHELSQTPERADVVHDLLASLAEGMIEMNRQKQTEVRGFLAWLERAVGAKVDDLSNKTRIRDYHEGDLDALLNALRQNRRKLKVNPDARDFQEGVEREFSRSTEKLAPLKERTAATDRLIDLMVYRLYGLTEEEIAIVEGERRA